MGELEDQEYIMRWNVRICGKGRGVLKYAVLISRYWCKCENLQNFESNILLTADRWQLTVDMCDKEVDKVDKDVDM